MLKMIIFSPIKYLVESIKVKICLIKKYQDVFNLSQPGHVMFCSTSQVKHLMARLPVTSCCTTNTASHNRILHNLGHCSVQYFTLPLLLSISVSSISSFSVCSHCHKKILNTESSLILDNSIVYLVTCFTQYSSVYCAS